MRFNPNPGTNYSVETSVAVITRDLGPVNLTMVRDDAQALVIDTGSIQVSIAFQPFLAACRRKAGLRL